MAVTPANKIVRGDDLTTVAQEIDKYFQRKATGKGLSTNDYTTDEKTKLAGIESGAQKNVKPDWNAASGSAAEILNKPTVPSTDSPTFTTKVSISSNSSNELTVQPNSPALLMGKYSGISYTYSIPVAVDSSKTNGTLALQSDIPTSTSALTNDSGFVTTTQVNTAISNALKGGYVVANPLPTASADTLGKIYLVPMTDTEDSNVKEEYVTWLDGSTYKWEKLGTTKFDNSDYEERLTAAEITTLLNL